MWRAQNKKVFRVMMEEKEVGGEWWKMIEKDMEKYEIESCGGLILLKRENLLKEHMDTKRREKREKEDQTRESMVDALPDS